MTLTCPACSKAFSAPPEAAGHTIRCGCGAEFAVPIRRPAPPPLPSPRPAPVPPPPSEPRRRRPEPPAPLLDWPGAGFLGRAALILAAAGAGLAAVGWFAWDAAAAGLDPLGWSLYSRRPMMPSKYQSAYRTLDAGRLCVEAGSGTALLALALATANAIQARPPRATARPVQVATLSLALGLVALVVCTPPALQYTPF